MGDHFKLKDVDNIKFIEDFDQLYGGIRVKTMRKAIGNYGKISETLSLREIEEKFPFWSVQAKIFANEPIQRLRQPVGWELLDNLVSDNKFV